jgi:2-dehydro-3-deoxyphosphogalactonate aldolase
LIGAGTVLGCAQVRRLADIGAELIVSPNTNHDVITLAKEMRMTSYPGIQTPSEAFSALDAGADALKLFPASCLGFEGVKAMKAVLPSSVRLLAVGGVGADNFADWQAAGIDGFGIGGALYKPGMQVGDVVASAAKLVQSYDRAYVGLVEASS